MNELTNGSFTRQKRIIHFPFDGNLRLTFDAPKKCVFVSVFIGAFEIDENDDEVRICEDSILQMADFIKKKRSQK